MMDLPSDQPEGLPALPPAEGESTLPSGEPPAPEGQATSTVNNNSEVHQQQNYGNVGNIYNNVYSSAEEATRTPLEDLPDDLPRLPPGMHPFREPRHERLLTDLEDRRIVLLSSYQESAAYAAAFTLAHDEHFRGQAKRALLPTRSQDKERTDLDLLALTEERFLGQRPQILLIEINSTCTLLDSVLGLSWNSVGSIHDRLKPRSSYLLLVVNEDLVRDEVISERARSFIPYYAVSHIRYLLTRDFADQAADLERRLLSCLDRQANRLALRELQQRVAKRLAEGRQAFEEFLCELEQVSRLPLAVRKERLQPIRPEDLLKEASEVQQMAAFVATYVPDAPPGDFERLLLLLLNGEGSPGERLAWLAGSEAKPRVPLDPWSSRWHQLADKVFRDCHLEVILAGDGSWRVDFAEPYLRRELRGHFERSLPWFVRRQCRFLQESGVLFAMDLSRTTVEGLVRLFVERAIVDPAGFGSVWLFDIVQGIRIQISGEIPSGRAEERLAWLLEKLLAERQLRSHFHSRLALLVREMLDFEELRPMVQEFFEALIAARQHDALLGVILDLARRLRFAPHFDPLVWMRRLLDQGSEAVRAKTARRLISLGRSRGPRIYEFLAAVKSWLPEKGRPVERFSASSRFALDVPFSLSLEIAKFLPPERFGDWPSRHPLFYALPDEPAEKRKEIVNLVAWALDPRGAALEQPDPTVAMRTAEVVRLEQVADLIEHWAWVLEAGTEEGPAEGRALFGSIVEEVNRLIGDRERAWLQRSWKRRQEEYLAQAATTGSGKGPGRALLVARRAKLDRLRMRFTGLADRPRPIDEPPQTKRGIAP